MISRSAGTAEINRFPTSTAHEKSKRSTDLAQQQFQGEKMLSSAAVTHVLIPSSHYGNAATTNRFQLETSASFSTEPRVSELVSPSYSPISPTSSSAMPQSIQDRFYSVDVLRTTENHTRSWPAPSSPPSTADFVPALAPGLSSFMKYDLRRYLPTHSLLRELGLSIDAGIKGVVYCLLDATNANPMETPHIVVHMSKPPFFRLCRLIFGVNSTNALNDVVSVMQMQSLLPLGEFLCSVIAVAGYEWVLQELHEPLPPRLPSKSEYVRLMENKIASGEYWSQYRR